MRGSSKRTLEEAAAHEESDDDDYDDHARGPAKARSRTKQARQPVRKRARRTYGGSDIDSDGEELDSDEDSFQDDFDDDEPETNEKGRPLRKAVKKQ